MSPWMAIRTFLYTGVISMQKIEMEEHGWMQGKPFPSGKELTQNSLHYPPPMNGKDGTKKGIGDLSNGDLPHDICLMNYRPIRAILKRMEGGFPQVTMAMSGPQRCLFPLDGPPT